MIVVCLCVFMCGFYGLVGWLVGFGLRTKRVFNKIL